MASTQSSGFDLPGFSLSLNYKSEKKITGLEFPNGVDYDDIVDGWAGRIHTFREILMMRAMNSISDKPEWDRKIFDEVTIAKWRKEIAGSREDVAPKMLEWIIKELQWNANAFQKTGIFLAFEAVAKSDSAIPRELQQALKEAIRPLENVPELWMDYHPGSDGTVVNLVHPSLFPVIYGRAHILTDKAIGLDDCLDDVGPTKLLPIPPEVESPLLGAFRWPGNDVFGP